MHGDQLAANYVIVKPIFTRGESSVCAHYKLPYIHPVTYHLFDSHQGAVNLMQPTEIYIGPYGLMFLGIFDCHVGKNR